jgi:hypothetical protein
MAQGITNQDHHTRNAKPENTFSYWAAQVSTRILELENRCTGNRSVGSNPTLSAKIFMLYAEQNGMPSPPQSTMSALPPKADILSVGPDVR